MTLLEQQAIVLSGFAGTMWLMAVCHLDNKRRAECLRKKERNSGRAAGSLVSRSKRSSPVVSCLSSAEDTETSSRAKRPGFLWKLLRLFLFGIWWNR